MAEFEVFLQGGSPWGFRLQGGREFRLPLRIAKVEPGGKADIGGIKVGDHVNEINELSTANLYHTEALTAVKRAQSTLSLVLKRPDDSANNEPAHTKTSITHQKQSSNLSNSSTEPVPSGQAYMKKIFGSTDDLLSGYDDLQPFERGRSKTLPKKMGPRDTQANDASNSNSLPRKGTSTIGPANKAPNWYKQMYKEMHYSMEGESQLSKLLSNDAQKGAFRKYDGVSNLGSVPANQTTDSVPRRLGGGRSIANHANRKSLPNLQASNFNFMAVNSHTNNTNMNIQPPSKTPTSPNIKKEHRKSINSDWYKQLQKGGDIPAAGLAVKTTPAKKWEQIKQTSLPQPQTQRHSLTSTRAVSEDYIPQQTSINVTYSNPPDFLELRKRELKNKEVEQERESLREKREQERIAEEERLRKQNELDRVRIEKEEEESRRLQQEKKKEERVDVGELVAKEVQQNREMYLQNTELPVEYAKAKYSFHPQGPGELEFKKGEKIRILQTIDQNWMEGEIDGYTGIFPISYVELLNNENEAQPPTEEVSNKSNNNNNNHSPISSKMEENTPVKSTLEEKIESPKNTQVEEEVIVNTAEIAVEKNPVVEPSLKKGKGVAKYTFRAESSNELNFVKGDEISIIRQIDDNWFEGESLDGDVGIFPVAYIQIFEMPELVTEDVYVEEIVPEEKHVIPDQKPFKADSTFEEIFKPKNLIISEKEEKTDTRKVENGFSFDEVSKSGNIDDFLSMGETFRAVYEYSATNEDEVDLIVGDIVHVLEQCDDGWYVGTCERTGAFGTFPGNYVTAF